MHEQEQRLRLHHQHELVFVAVVEVLVDAAVLDDCGIAGLVGNGDAVVARTMQIVESGAHAVLASLRLLL